MMTMMRMMRMMRMIMMLTTIDGDDWQRRYWWRSNVAMEHAFASFALVMDRKDFKQAYTVGHLKTSWIVVQYYPHQQKSYSAAGSSVWKFSIFLFLWNTWCQQPKAKHILCKGKFFSSELKHPCFCCCCCCCCCCFCCCCFMSFCPRKRE